MGFGVEPARQIHRITPEASKNLDPESHTGADRSDIDCATLAIPMRRWAASAARFFVGPSRYLRRIPIQPVVEEAEKVLARITATRELLEKAIQLVNEEEASTRGFFQKLGVIHKEKGKMLDQANQRMK